MNSRISKRCLAIFLMLMASALFSLMQIMVKLSSSGIGTMQQVFFRNLVSMIFAFTILKKKKLPLFGEKQCQLALLGRSLAGFAGVVMTFYALAHAKVADVSLLTKTSPAWVTLFAALLLKEKLTRVQIPVLCLCLAGAFVAMQPSFQSDALPLILAVLTGVSSGLAYTLIAYCKGRVNPLTVIFHFSMFSTIAAGILMLPTYIRPSLGEWGMLAMVGLCGSLGQIGLTYAYQLAPAAQISIYDYFGVVFSGILAYALLGEGLVRTSLLGGAMIIGGALLAFFYEKKGCD